jgi:hypothetical protein
LELVTPASDLLALFLGGYSLRTLLRHFSISIIIAFFVLAGARAQAPRTFRVWVFADAHVGTDNKQNRESLAKAIRQSESASGFDWDIALDLGDMSGEQGTPKDPEGQEIVRQFGALAKHRREQIYDLSGNHDRSGLDEPQAWWWRKWVDPTGEHSEFSQVDAAKRPFPIDGTWERYSFRVGNLLFLMMSDINELTQKVGRGTLGGNPGGVVSGETFRWWKRMVDDNPSSVIITAHHYVLKDTTTKTAPGIPPTTVIFLRARHKAPLFCTGLTANRIPARSKASWLPPLRRLIYGLGHTHIHLRMTLSARNRTSSGVGVRHSSTLPV